ncbi:hypothetical protein LPMP_333120 [Leishmania panamensis]|uniref:Uncharacterized protein n=1 Tax=Leishmania panamensis TaxID=5679 RepID=A0A088SIF4_LEIPA|nr:hypothetical protein LPMP_333120 [Leishmania panamensis]AIO01602.1 hypothetical protein LPMP_333120 [Leishmania panamensis]
MGRRKPTQPVETEVMQRHQSACKRRGSFTACNTGPNQNKNSGNQEPSGGGGDLAREHNSHLSRNRLKNGTSFRRLPQDQGSGGPAPYTSFNFVSPPQQHQQQPQQPQRQPHQQQQQPHQQQYFHQPSPQSYDKYSSQPTQNAQGQPYLPYGGNYESLPPQQLIHLRNLPPLPHVTTPQGPMAPPPLYLFAMQGCPLAPGMPPQQQRQRCEPPGSSNRAVPPQHYAVSGNAMPSALQPTLARRPSFIATKGRTVNIAPNAVPPTVVDPRAGTTDGTRLTRAHSILKHTSSFKKQAHPTSEVAKVGQKELTMDQRLHEREQERQRLQQEMQARMASEQSAREQRLRELEHRKVPQNVVPESLANTSPCVQAGLPNPGFHSGDSVSESCRVPASKPVPSSQLPTSVQSLPGRPTGSVPFSKALQRHPVSKLVARSPASGESPGMAALVEGHSKLPASDGADNLTMLDPKGNGRVAASGGGAAAVVAKSKGPARGASATATAEAPAVAMQQLWHCCLSLALYEIPLRCRKTVKNDEEHIDDSKFPVRLFGSTLRVTDAVKQTSTEYQLDEVVTHRRGSTNVESNLLEKVGEVLIEGYSASVLSLDSKGLCKSTSAFDSAAWLAKQRLLMNVLRRVKGMQSVYSERVGSGDFFEAAFSFAIVKKVSSQQAAEWNITSVATAQRTYGVVDLLQPEPTVVQFKMDGCLLFGHRIAGVEYRALRSEAEFKTVLTSAQVNANIVLGRLADAVAADPDNEAAANEQESVLQVITCVLTHRKTGPVSLQEQMVEPAEAVYKREAERDVMSSDDEDDTDLPTVFRSHNVPSGCSDIIMNCLTCIGAQQSHGLWAAALERNQRIVPTALFETAFGGPAYTVILASIDPTKVESAAALDTQSAMSLKLHRRPLNGSARRFIQCSKYVTVALQTKLSGTIPPSDAQQRDLKAEIHKRAMGLDSLGKMLSSLETNGFRVSGTTSFAQVHRAEACARKS